MWKKPALNVLINIPIKKQNKSHTGVALPIYCKILQIPNVNKKFAKVLQRFFIIVSGFFSVDFKLLSPRSLFFVLHFLFKSNSLPWCKKLRFLDESWYSNLSRFQGARPDHAPWRLSYQLLYWLKC